MIPKNLINPVGAKMMSLYPQPNRPGLGPNQVNNFFAQGPADNTNDKMDTRVDWEQNSVHRLFVRWSDRFREDSTNPCFFCTGGDGGVNEHDNGFQVVLNDTITPSPTWVINSFVSYSRWQEAHTAQTLGVADAATIGLIAIAFPGAHSAGNLGRKLLRPGCHVWRRFPEIHSLFEYGGD